MRSWVWEELQVQHVLDQKFGRLATHVSDGRQGARGFAFPIFRVQTPVAGMDPCKPSQAHSTLHIIPRFALRLPTQQTLNQFDAGISFPVFSQCNLESLEIGSCLLSSTSI